ncbi:MAG TPA: TonB-dependent receptor [Candidatus Krumholzibacteria bacterium]|nr:TonB-dependent receptor [Candidatus Krumholzibacteria bacterium]
MRGALRLPDLVAIVVVLGIPLLVGPAAATSQHVPGMSLTAGILAEDDAAAVAETGDTTRPARATGDTALPARADTTTTRTAAGDSTSTGTRATVPDNAPGTITGHVRDAESGRALPYTNIILDRVRPGARPEQAGGSIALTGGQYFARVAPGTYDVSFLYLGYETFTAEDVVVAPGSTVTLDVDMTVKPIEFTAMTVQAQKITNTAVAQLQEKKRATAVQEAITAEEISKSTDSDAAEALERVTGLSVVGGKFVFVRGLGDRYSSTTLNGAPLSSPEPSRNTVPLDIFPAAMLDNIVVQKAFTPDMDGNFGGGNIDVRTRRGVDERVFQQKISYGFNQSVIDNDFLTYEGGATDLFARDDGTRGFPRLLEAYEDRSFTPRNASEAEQFAATFSFPNVWTPERVEGPPNFGYSGLYSDSFEIEGRRGSVLAAASYSHGVKTEDFEQYVIRTDEIAPPKQQANTLRSERSVLLGVTGAVTFQPTTGTSLQYNLLYTRSGEDAAYTSVGRTDSEETQFLSHTLKFVERDLLTHVLQGRHTIGPHGSELHWMGSTSEATRNEPDNRYSRFAWANSDRRVSESGEQYNVGVWTQPNIASGFQRLFGETDENARAFRVNWDLVMPEKPWVKRRLKVGFGYRERERDEGYRRFLIRKPSPSTYVEAGGGGRAEDIFELSSFNDPVEALRLSKTEELTNPFDSYDAQQEITALYAMLDLDFFETLRVTGGARFESNQQTASSLSLNGAEAGLPSIEADASAEDWLPALNLTWRTTDRMQIRGGYSRTLNRPQLRELAGLRIFDFDADEVVSGNPFLRTATVDAFDFRWEIFPAPRSYAALSFFDKTIDNAILTNFTNQAGGGLVLYPANGEQNGSLRGWEVEWRGPLDDVLWASRQAAVSGAWLVTRPFWLLGQIPGLSSLGDWTPAHRVARGVVVPALRNWGFTFNYSGISSSIDLDPIRAENELFNVVDPDGDPQPSPDGTEVQENRLTGQADSAFNLGLFYGNGNQDFSLLFKDFGLRQESAALQTFIDPPLVVDAAFSTRLGPNARLKLSVEDIFPQDVEEFYDDILMERVDGSTFDTRRLVRAVGPKYGASISYDF